jgi:MarR family transcriptional regulator, transcriptional regulator for hemolysin
LSDYIEKAANNLATITEILYEEEESFLREIEAVGLSARHLKSLDLIASLGNPTPGEMTAALKIRKPSVAALIAELAERECIKKVKSDVDGREYHVYLTKKARDIVLAHGKVHWRFAERLMGPLSPAEQRTFAAMIAKIAQEMSAAGGEK